MYVLVCAQIHLPVLAHTLRGQRRMLGILIHHSLQHIFRKGLSLNLELAGSWLVLVVLLFLLTTVLG